MDGLDLLDQEFLGNPLWRYFLLFAIVLVGLGVARTIGYILGHRLMNLRKTTTKLEEVAIETIRRALYYIILLVALRIGLDILTLPKDIDKIVGSIFNILVALVVVYVLVRMVDLFIVYLEPRVGAAESKLDSQLLPILRKSIKIFIWIIAVLAIVQNMGYNILSLLAGLGLGGLAVALAAKETLSNFFGSIAIFSDRPFRAGDRVQVEGYEGSVESIGFRSTKLRTPDGTLVTIPNSKMANACINNIQARPTIKRSYTIGISYNSGYKKIQRALEILREIHSGIEGLENHSVYFKEFGVYSLNIEVISWWCKDLQYEEYLKTQERINLEVMRRFNEEGIEFAFSPQIIYVKGNTPPQRP